MHKPSREGASHSKVGFLRICSLCLTNTSAGHSFFDPQPAENKNVAVWLLRMIMHNWPDAECIKILKNIRASCNKDTRIVIVDNIMLYASRSQEDENQLRQILETIKDMH